MYMQNKKGGTLWAKCTVNTEYETPKITSETRGFDTIVIYALFQLEAFIFPARPGLLLFLRLFAQNSRTHTLSHFSINLHWPISIKL